jgi:hypothetical protein
LTTFNLDKINGYLGRVPQEFDGKSAHIGWFEDAKYEDGTPVAEVAAQNEFGVPTEHIPPRPFMRPTVADKGMEWATNLGLGVVEVQDKNMTATQVLDAVGSGAAGDIQKTISLITSPAISAYTISKRLERGNASIKPLVDTGQMLASLHAVTVSE